LSGTGGDEMNGQPLDPCVLMADLLLELRLAELGRQLTKWSFRMRRPWIQVLLQSILQLLPISVRAQFAENGKVESWVSPGFARKYSMSARQLEKVRRIDWQRPSARDAIQTIETLRRQLTFTSPSLLEKRLPYLDKDLMEFLTSVPLDQLLRP